MGRGRWRRLKCRHGPGLKIIFWHLSISSIHSKRMRLSRQMCHPMLQRVKTPIILLIAGVDGIYLGPGQGRKSMEGCRYTRGRSVCPQKVMKTTQVASRKRNKSDLATRKICVPLVPVEYVDHIYWLSETSSGPGLCTASG